MGENIKALNCLTDQAQYQLIIDYLVESGKRLVDLSGKVADIGVTKQYLTEEDIRIERGLEKLIKSFGDDHILFAEEENDIVKESDDFWIVDPISGTESFIKGGGLYTVVVSHSHQGISQFAAVYHPTANELYVAYLGQGVKLNGQPIKIRTNISNKPKVILRVSKYCELWNGLGLEEKLKNLLSDYEVIQFNYSISTAINYCSVASGEYDGIIVFGKDCFPDFAGGMIIREAGGELTNLDGDSNLKPTDRIFIGGAKEVQRRLLPIIKKALDEI